MEQPLCHTRLYRRWWARMAYRKKRGLPLEPPPVPTRKHAMCPCRRCTYNRKKSVDYKVKRIMKEVFGEDRV